MFSCVLVQMLMQKRRPKSYQDALDDMHKDVGGTLSSERKKAVEQHNAKTHVRLCSFSVGEFLAVAHQYGPRTKMSANWVSPLRIDRVLPDFTFEVERLLTKETEVVHVSRVKHYADSSVGAKVNMEEIAEITDKVWYSVDSFKNVRRNGANFELLVSWKGLSSGSDSW